MANIIYISDINMNKNKLIFIFILSIITCIAILYKLQRLKIYEQFVENSIMPQLNGGLGNQLFNLATVYGISREYNKPIAINPGEVQNSAHSQINYIDTIFQKFKQYFTDDKAEEHIPNTVGISDISQYTSKTNSLLFETANHRYKLFDKYRNDFINMLTFDKSIANKYPRLGDSMFIHVRGGDYKNLGGFFLLELEAYYKNAIEYCKQHNVKHYYIFTNDIEHIRKKYPFILELPHQIVDENEIDSIYLMSQCQLGGISSNGTFGWWALYLNINRPHLIIPSQWGSDPASKTWDLDYPGFTIINVN